MKKIFLVLLVLISLLGFRTVKADVVIDEVMYAPANGSSSEWVEIYNNGDVAVDLNGWRFFNSQTSSSPLHSSGSFILEANAYAIITGSDNTESYSCQQFTASSFSLPDDSSKYQTYKGIYSDSEKTIGNSVVYDTSLGGSKESGTSLSKIDGTWESGIPTPGKQNQVSNNDTGNNSSDNESSSSNSSSNNNSSDNTNTNTNTTKTKVKVAEIPTMKAKVLTDNVAFAGEPLEINSSILGYSNEKIVLGKLYWNFGDGSSQEQINKFDKFTHTYLYPGEYVLSLEYYPNNSATAPDVINKVTIKVVPLTVSISKVGDAKDFFIELTNNSAYDMDISKWTLNSFNKNFLFPKNSIILAKKTMIVPGKTSGFVLGDDKNLKLSMPTGEVISVYGASFLPAKIYASGDKSLNEHNNQKENDIKKDYTNSVINQNIQANAIDSNQNIIDNSKNFAFIGGLVVLLGFAGSLVYFLRQKRIIKTAGDDFEILDE